MRRILPSISRLRPVFVGLLGCLLVAVLHVPAASVPAFPVARAAAQATPEEGAAPGDRIDGERLLEHLSVLAHDSMQGRRTGTPGNERARRYLLLRFDQTLEPVRGVRSQQFRFTPRGESEEQEGLNIMGMIQGTEHPERYLVVTAHYDHLGVQDGEIYNGTDDNASGTAALLELAEYFRQDPPSHSVVFLATDAEEMGLQGARTWLEQPTVPLEAIVLNVNLDMISRSEAGELYAAGTHHYPFLGPLVDSVAARAPVRLLRGHDTPDLPPGDDWTMASDHGPFHEKGVPFLYFGVEDHDGYHHPSDTVENTTPEFYVAAVETVLDFVLEADRHGESIMEGHPTTSTGRRP